MTSSSLPLASPARPNVVAPERAKKLSKRLLRLAHRQDGTVKIGQLSDAQAVIAELFGLPSWHALMTHHVADQAGLPPATAVHASPQAEVALQDQATLHAWPDMPDVQTWKRFQSSSGQAGVDGIFRALVEHWKSNARAILTQRLNLWLVIQRLSDYTVMVDVGEEDLAPSSPSSMSALQGIKGPWWERATPPNPSVWVPMGRAFDRAGILPNVVRVELFNAAQSQGQGLDSEYFKQAKAWLLILLEQDQPFSVVVRISSSDGAMYADVATQADTIGATEWNGLRATVAFDQAFGAQVTSTWGWSNYKIRVPQKRWLWEPTPIFSFENVHCTEETVGWSTRSEHQTSHVQHVVSALPQIRTRWLSRSVQDLEQNLKHPVHGILVVSAEQQKTLVSQNLAMFELPEGNPFALPQGLSQPDERQTAWLVGGLLELTRLTDIDGAAAVFNELLICTYKESQPGAEIRLSDLVMLLQAPPRSVLTLAEDLSVGEHQLLHLIVQRLTQALVEHPGLTRSFPRQALNGLVTIVPSKDKGMAWFAMAQAYASTYHQKRDLWALDVTALPATSKHAQQAWLDTWHTHVLDVRKDDGVMITMNDEALDDRDDKLFTLVVTDQTDPLRDATPVMHLLAMTNHGMMEREVRWLD